MAYMDQAKKAQLAPRIKAICTKHGIKASLAVHNHLSLVLNIQSGPIDFIGSYNRLHMKRAPQYPPATGSVDVNEHWYKEHFDGEAKAFLAEVIHAMNIGNHDRSDLMTDYFDVGWYITVHVGRWNKPYELITKEQTS